MVRIMMWDAMAFEVMRIPDTKKSSMKNCAKKHFSFAIANQKSYYNFGVQTLPDQIQLSAFKACIPA
jgi:hypothetical protein